MYNRNIVPQFQFGSPMAQVAPSQGAGGAIPSGVAPMQAQDNGGMDPTQIGGLLGMIGKMGNGNGLNSYASQAANLTSAIPGIGNTFAEGAQGGGTGAFDWIKNMFGGGA